MDITYSQKKYGKVLSFTNMIKKHTRTNIFSTEIATLHWLGLVPGYTSA